MTENQKDRLDELRQMEREGCLEIWGKIKLDALEIKSKGELSC